MAWFQWSLGRPDAKRGAGRRDAGKRGTGAFGWVVVCSSPCWLRFRPLRGAGEERKLPNGMGRTMNALRAGVHVPSRPPSKRCPWWTCAERNQGPAPARAWGGKGCRPPGNGGAAACGLPGQFRPPGRTRGKAPSRRGGDWACPCSGWPPAGGGVWMGRASSAGCIPPPTPGRGDPRRKLVRSGRVRRGRQAPGPRAGAASGPAQGPRLDEPRSRCRPPGPRGPAARSAREAPARRAAPTDVCLPSLRRLALRRLSWLPSRRAKGWPGQSVG
jgi:hypothetical protein